MFEMKGLYTILLLMMSNAFMTIAWYGHLKLKTMTRFENITIFAVILLSWGVAFFEYTLQVPANRLGFRETGGPFSLIELKVIQEVISILVFSVFTLLVFKNEQFRVNHLIGFVFLILAVYFIFRK
jgi:uncharacterized protein (DUF486 family)